MYNKRQHTFDRRVGLKYLWNDLRQRDTAMLSRRFIDIDSIFSQNPNFFGLRLVLHVLEETNKNYISMLDFPGPMIHCNMDLLSGACPMGLSWLRSKFVFWS